MRVLLDQNLSPKLIRKLADILPGLESVYDHDLTGSSDRFIFAKLPQFGGFVACHRIACHRIAPELPFFVRTVLPESAQEARLGGAPEVGDQLAQKPLAVRTFIVQNGPEWS